MSASFKFSKVANISVISVWLNLSPYNFCAACLITAHLSLTFATTRQWSVPWSAPLKLCTPSTLEQLACDWLLWSSERQGVSNPSFLGAFGGHGLLLAILDSSTRSHLWFGWPACRGDCCPDFPMGLRWCLAYVKEVKLVWFLGDFKLQFPSCILEYWEPA